MVRLSGICYESLVNGDGLRRVFFAQGCRHNCKNCFNPETHNFDGGRLENIDSLITDIIRDNYLDGVTFSGGDPFEQSEPFTYFAKVLHDNKVNIWCYTGYTFEELLQNPKQSKMLKYIDILVDGRFIVDLKDISLKFRGSSNQRIIDVQESLKQHKIVLSQYN